MLIHSICLFTVLSSLCLSLLSGVIRTAVSSMDRESRDRYMVVIQAKDMAGSVGGLSGSTTVNVTLTDVNDNPPKFSQSTYHMLGSETCFPKHREDFWVTDNHL